MCQCQCRHNMRWLHLAAQDGEGFTQTLQEPLRIPWEEEDLITFGEEGKWYHRVIPRDDSFPAVPLQLYSAEEAERIVTELSACRCCRRHQRNRPLALAL